MQKRLSNIDLSLNFQKTVYLTFAIQPAKLPIAINIQFHYDDYDKTHTYDSLEINRAISVKYLRCNLRQFIKVGYTYTKCHK